ncbi:MAG TPA: bacillithiol system redox-active protein YtxJ [Salinimicrobium sp.]|nr:bacillithiol system redox-active protein YtxJ [Salinimicrobium sp.]
MGFFDKVFKSEREIAKEDIVEIPWHPLTRHEQLEEIDKESEEKPVVIFKHSTRCGISRMVLKKFEKEFPLVDTGNQKLYFLDLLSNRPISDEIARHYQVRHESPQMLIIRNRKAVYHASHQSIEAEYLKETD